MRRAVSTSRLPSSGFMWMKRRILTISALFFSTSASIRRAVFGSTDRTAGGTPARAATSTTVAKQWDLIFMALWFLIAGDRDVLKKALGRTARPEQADPGAFTSSLQP